MVVGIDEQLQVPMKLIVIGLAVPFDGGLLDGSVHSFDLAIGPRTVQLGQTVFDSILCANTVEQMACKLCC